MSAITVRGGTPKAIRVTATTTYQTVSFGQSTCYLKVRTQDNAAKMYFTAADAIAGNNNYVIIPAPTAAEPYGEWSGPADTTMVYVVTATGTASLEICAFLRLG